MVKRFARFPVEFHCPKIDELESALHRAFYQRIEFFLRYLIQRWQKPSQLLIVCERGTGVPPVISYSNVPPIIRLLIRLSRRTFAFHHGRDARAPVHHFRFVRAFVQMREQIAANAGF